MPISYAISFSGAAIVLFNSIDLLAVDVPQFIGQASCATATCHGGVIGTGPQWHTSASVWQSRDPHAMAGEVLMNELSRQIVVAMDPSAVDDRQRYLRVLRDRCAGCHAPAGSHDSRTNSIDAQELRRSFASGVSCEACHGPASRWEKPHVRVDWNQSDRFNASTGMLDTESLLARTDNCVRCHVGSRSRDGVIRDMNHDMIAAGHPALYFDMYRHFSRYSDTVSHWEKSQEMLVNLTATKLSKTIEGLQTRVLWAASQLSLERQSEQASIPQPELSEFDCVACHHSLQLNSPRLRRKSSGYPSWQPWYVAGRVPSELRERLRWGQPNLNEAVRQLTINCQSRSEAFIGSPEVDPLAVLEGLLSGSSPDNRFDYFAAPNWIDQIEVVSAAAKSKLPDNVGKRIEGLLRQFRTHKLGYSREVPTAMERLIAAPWEVRDLGHLRMELKSCIAVENSRGSQ